MVAVEQMFRLDGKIAVITGASRGIGHALADALGRAGAACVGLARSAGPVTPFTSSVTYIPADITVDPVTVIDAVARQHSRIDILINAAGISLATTAPEMAMQVFDQTLQTNLRAAFAVSTAAARHMPPGSSIINVTSIEGSRAAPGYAVYAACKAGINNLTRTLAVEFADHRIRVNAIAPDFTVTPGTRGNFTGPVDESTWFKPSAAQVEAFRRRIPLERPGIDAECGHLAVFLASRMASYITGTVIPIDGGTWGSGGWVRDSTGDWILPPEATA